MSIHVRSRWAIDANYKDDDFVEFPMMGKRYRVPHSVMVQMAKEDARYTLTRSWLEHGEYNIKQPSKRIQDRCAPYEIAP